MPPKLKNRLKLGLWILLPLILLSFISNRFADSPLPVDEGMYALSTIGANQLEITGDVGFQEDEIVSKNGNLLKILKINFNDATVKDGMDMQFMISLKSDAEAIQEGKYYVNRYISGFVGEFSGVFGYANMHAHGEEPYFSKMGHLDITSKSEDMVQGTMKVTMEDVAGEKLKFQGSFKAIRQ